MNNILNLIRKRDYRLYECIKNSNSNWNVYNFVINFSVYRAEYMYTNSLSGKRKGGIKYFIFSRKLIMENPNRFEKIFEEWIGKENISRKNKILNVKLNNYSVMEGRSLNGKSYESVLGSKKYVRLKKNVEEKVWDIGQVLNIESILDLLGVKYSNNPKDYVIMYEIFVRVYKIKMFYITRRGSERYREQYVISMEGESLSVYERSYTDLKSIVSNSISAFNVKYPYRSIECTDIETISEVSIRL